MLVMKIVAVLALAGACFAQQTRSFEEEFHKTLTGGLPFMWPVTMDQAANGTVRKEDVLRLLEQLYPADLAAGSMHPVYAMESFRFVSLEKDRIYLVAVTDITGRDFFNCLEIILCDGKKCDMWDQHSDAENDLNEQLVDIDGDGVFEMITTELAGGYDGATSRPLYLYSIRKFMNGDMVDVSSKYLKYFQDHILPKMEADKREVEKTFKFLNAPKPIRAQDSDRRPTIEEETALRQYEAHETKWKAKATAELQYVQDEYHRRVLGEKTAGLENALRWAESDELEIKRFGIAVLELIESPLAAAAIQKLASSPDTSISERARMALDRRAEKGLPPPGR
jgi:hypothetical protein